MRTVLSGGLQCTGSARGIKPKGFILLRLLGTAELELEAVDAVDLDRTGHRKHRPNQIEAVAAVGQRLPLTRRIDRYARRLRNGRRCASPLVEHPDDHSTVDRLDLAPQL